MSGDARKGDLRIVFLDIDGVINCTATYDRLMQRNLPIHDDADWIEPELLARLDRICQRTGALVVVHSSWRYKYNFVPERFNQLFAKYQTKHIHVVDCTHGERWDGIAAWVYQQKGRVLSHVILDDMEPHEPLEAHVKTTEREGLTEELAKRAVELLLRKMWRCRECGDRSPRAWCFRCDMMGGTLPGHSETTGCLDCGFTSNVSACIAAHDFGHTEDT